MDVPPLLAPLPLANELVKCWSYDPQDRPSFDSLLKEIKGLLVFKDELQTRVCCRYDDKYINLCRGTFFFQEVTQPSTQYVCARSSTILCDIFFL